MRRRSHPPAVYGSYAVDVNNGVTNQSMSLGADLTGAADSKAGVLSYWVKRASGNTDLLKSTGDGLRLKYNGSHVFSIKAENAAGTTILDMNSSAVDPAIWHHVLVAWDLAVPGSGRLLIDGLDDKTEVTYTDDLIDHTRGGWDCPAGGSRKLIGCMAEVYLNIVSYIDVETKKHWFRTAAGKPRDVRRLGNGLVPILYLRNPAASAGVNSGSGQNLTVSNGPLLACAGSV